VFYLKPAKGLGLSQHYGAMGSLEGLGRYGCWYDTDHSVFEMGQVEYLDTLEEIVLSISSSSHMKTPL
jgi:hypothetical protein